MPTVGVGGGDARQPARVKVVAKSETVVNIFTTNIRQFEAAAIAEIRGVLAGSFGSFAIQIHFMQKPAHFTVHTP